MLLNDVSMKYSERLVKVCQLRLLTITQLEVVIYKAFSLDEAPGRMNGAPNEAWTHLWRFVILAC